MVLQSVAAADPVLRTLAALGDLQRPPLLRRRLLPWPTQAASRAAAIAAATTATAKAAAAAAANAANAAAAAAAAARKAPSCALADI